MSSTKDFIQALEIPEPSERVSKTHESDLSSIKFRGEVVGKDDNSLSIDCGGVIYDINIDDISSIQADDAPPSPDQIKGPAVIATVSPSAVVSERRRNAAGALIKEAGLRPLVYALPSAAADYEVTEDQMIMACNITVGFCTGPTPQPTPYATGNTIDARNDYFNDNTVDQQCD